MSHTPLTHRALVQREEAHLKRDELGIDKFIEVTLIIFACLVLAVVVCAYVPKLSILIGIASFLAVACMLVIIYLFFQLFKYRGDLHDHIYHLQGVMRKTDRMTHDHTLAIGKHQFKVMPSNPTLWDFYNNHPGGTHVSVYYSPRTKIVWTISKV